MRRTRDGLLLVEEGHDASFDVSRLSRQEFQWSFEGERAALERRMGAHEKRTDLKSHDLDSGLPKIVDAQSFHNLTVRVAHI